MSEHAPEHDPTDGPGRITRRRLLGGAMAAAAVGTAGAVLTTRGGGTATSAPPATSVAPASAAPLLPPGGLRSGEPSAMAAELFDDDAAIVALGVAALASRAGFLAPAITGTAAPEPPVVTVDPDLARRDPAAVRAAIEADLRAGRLVSVDGWLLSATEVQLCLHAARGR